MIPSSIKVSFDEILKGYYDPKELKYGLSNLLRQMNIISETMYPGLEGLARSMSCLRDSIGDYKAD